VATRYDKLAANYLAFRPTASILFTSRKGGVGKSTLARATAIALAAEGRKVLLADFDVEQRTCLRWQAQRLARHLEPAIDVEKFSKGVEARSRRASL
jgi:chromosome partitioning protein